MTRTTDPADPEPSSVSGPSSLQLTPDSDPTSPDPDPEPMDPQPGASNHELPPHTDLVDSQPMNVSRQSSLKMTPDLKQEPVPGPSGLHSELTSLPGPAVGSFFSLYDVGVSLGSGNFGTVYEGTRRSDGQKVAIKFLTKSVQDCFIYVPGSIRPLLGEVALNLVVREPPQSPNIVQMYEWFEQHHRYILILEYPHPCETLLSFTLSNGGYLEETVARGLMHQAVLAAKHCLDRRVFHRDIKSDNILVNTETLQLKLIDFGCGKLFETSDYDEYTGCPAVKATVKSLGVLLFRMVNGISFVEIQMIPSSTLSSECCDLLNQCKSSSLTLDKLLEHEWFRKS
ncbi:serine/threonine-protein kinase pim-2-like [Carassius auratus]|uniref:non-specific serine/threonine protein kinase n=1 Tax=Carassius auratus TaxID=7957 RepID=A0A6P6R627_CARAU|nr:serine/threonine-protein kinase pim-2-like [Carassius auratus]